MLVVKTTSPATSPSPVKLCPSKTAPSSRTTFARGLTPYPKPRSYVIVHQRATNYSTRDPTRQAPPEIRRVGGPAQERASLDDPPLREVYQRQVRRGADPQAPRATDPATRATAHRLHQPRERDSSVQDQLGVEGGEGRLVPEEAGCGLLQRELLLLGGVRGVVGSHEVQNPVPQGLRDAPPVGVWSQRRVDPVEALQGGDEVVSQRQMVRGCVGGHVRAAFEEPDERRRERGGDVGYVDLRAGLRREHQRRRRGHVLGACRRARDAGERGEGAVVHDAGR